MNHAFDAVKCIAEQVRYWAEGRAVGSRGEETLSGWCAIAAAELWRRLADEGIVAEIHCWVCPDQESAHVYLVVDDHIVDVTATQFSKMRNIPVFIKHQREAECYGWYSCQADVFKTPEDLIRYQKKTRWAKAQIAWNR